MTIMIRQLHSSQSSCPAVRGMAMWSIAGALLIVALLCLSYGSLPQSLQYHDFADQRSLLGMPHTWNVLSNVGFLLAGIWGCVLIAKPATRLSGIDAMYFVFFAGLFLTGLGSGYYHWAPGNDTLVWDRLPMAIAFMAFTSLVISERYSEILGRRLFPWLLTIGVLSVIYWHWQDDLRPYLVVQFVPMLLLPLIIWRFKGPGTRWLSLTFVFYVAAKLVEVFDQQLYALTESMVSGHTLKHLFAAMGVLMIVAKASAVDGNRATQRGSGTYLQSACAGRAGI